MLAFTRGEFIFWVAVGVVAALVAAMLLGGWNWLRRRIREWRSRPKADPPKVDLDNLGKRERTYVQALLHEREGYVQKGMKDRAEQVDAEIVRTRDDWSQRATKLRVALKEIRTELESARLVLQEASDRESFWNPEQEQLPGQRWDDHREVLSAEPEVGDTRAAIEDAYQRCNRLNQHALKRATEAKADEESHTRRLPGWAYDFDYYDKDGQNVKDALTAIDWATTSITVTLEKL
jgi:chromosome segregation ATPase